MLAPHELKHSPFSKSLRGYSTVEVEEHIEFLIEKYTELYRLNDELEKKLRLTEAQLDAIRGEEESIRATLINAQKASTRIINEANERADVIMRSAKSSCDRLIAELKANVKKENDRLREVQREVAAFKTALFEGYQSHIEQIEAIAPDVSIVNVDESQAEELSRLVLERIRRDLSGKSELISGSDDPFSPKDEDDVEVVTSSLSVETAIPDSDDDVTLVSPDPAAYTVARDSEDFTEEEDEDDLNEQTVVVEKGAGILDSLRRLNHNADAEESDASFLDTIRKLSDTDDDDDDDSTAIDEFTMVYDGKKKQ
ncbi:MAG: DivIVA domain-containing protein [Ruminococcaceae bacterium]|nr:DivIVA domain-containing protein [Oscillospiraceae bacterium]